MEEIKSKSTRKSSSKVKNKEVTTSSEVESFDSSFDIKVLDITPSYLQKYQERLYTFFSNAKKNDHIPHSLLLHGDLSCNLLEIATYIAKSVNCTKSIFSCETECDHCVAWNTKARANFLLIDGTSKNIVREDIDNLQSRFSLGSQETDIKSIYIINEVNNITNEAANELLKFLEEPKTNTLAILLTTNIEKVLPTIRSRSTILRLNTNPFGYSYVYSKTGNSYLSFLISSLAGDKVQMDGFLEDEQFIDIATEVFDIIKNLESNKKEKAVFNLLNNIGKNFKGSKNYLYFYKIFCMTLIEILKVNNTEDPNNIHNIEYNLGFNKVNFIKNKEIIIKLINLLNDIISRSMANFNFLGVLGKISNIILKGDTNE